MLKLAKWLLLAFEALCNFTNFSCCNIPANQSVLKDNLGRAKALRNIQVRLINTFHNSLTVFHRELDVVEGCELYGSDPVPLFDHLFLKLG